MAGVRHNGQPIDHLLARLRCPGDGRPLAYDSSGNHVVCVVPDGGDGAHHFPVIDERPLLIDSSASVVDVSGVQRSRGESAVERQRFGRVGSVVKRLVDAESPVSRQNYRSFFDELTVSNGQGDRPTLLNIGSGTVGPAMSRLLDRYDVDVLGFDIYLSSTTDFVADAHSIPMPDQSVDAVFIQAVLEHVLDPRRVVDEIERVLRPEGLVYAETPFLQAVHEGPYDFTRFTESGHRYLFRHFSVIDSGVVAGPGRQTVWAIEFLVRSLTRSPFLGRVARVLVSWLAVLDRFVDPRFASDAASAVYFFGRLGDRAIGPKEAVEFYPGAQ